jgi:hypothetical protein
MPSVSRCTSVGDMRLTTRCLCMASQITLLIWLNARRRIGGPAGGETSYEQEDRGEQQRPVSFSHRARRTN